MASPTWWTWVWVKSRSWWWTGRPGVLHFMGSQRVRHDWATELNWTEWVWSDISLWVLFAWMWELDCEESWALKNWCFWTVVLEKTLETPLDCKEIKPSILKETNPGCSLEGLMIKPKLQYSGHLMWRVESLAGGERDDRGWDGWMASPTRCTWVWVNSGSWWWTGRLGVLRFMGSQRVGHDWATELNWTEWLIMFSIFSYASWSSVYLLWKNVYWSALPFFDWDVGVFVVQLQFFIILCILDLYQTHDLQIFLPFFWLPFPSPYMTPKAQVIKEN